jgi:hypothetical protein
VPHCAVPGLRPWHHTDLLSSQISARPEAHADWLVTEALIPRDSGTVFSFP